LRNIVSKLLHNFILPNAVAARSTQRIDILSKQFEPCGHRRERFGSGESNDTRVTISFTSSHFQSAGAPRRFAFSSLRPQRYQMMSSCHARIIGMNEL
jgi:hypothetical protein